jgi:polyisoprenyl-phosphate glycosyltransferase
MVHTQKISVISPVYNNADHLVEHIDSILTVHKQFLANFSLEIVLVNDGSRDSSLETLLHYKKKYPEVIKLINLTRNFGQLGALHAGFQCATGDAMVCISADMQDPIALLPEMVQKWQQGSDVVICHRSDRHDGFLTKTLSKAAYAIARITYPELPPGGFDYWLMSKRVCKKLNSFKGRHNFIQGYVMAIGYKRAFIPYTRQKRKSGKSGYKLGKKIKIVFDFLVDTSYVPMRLISLLGVLFSLTGFLYSGLIVYAWAANKTPFPGWAPLMIITLLSSGVIMLMLGFIGEFIWRIYDNSKDFPLYILDEDYDQ